MQYAMFYKHRCEQSGGQENVFETPRQIAHTDVCKTYHTAYTAISLRMNTRGSKHVGDIRN
jgi:hypothetical protein